MNKMFFSALFLLTSFISQASSTIEGYYVTNSNDTVFVQFENIDLRKGFLYDIKNGIWYIDENKEQILLSPGEAKVVKVYFSGGEDFDIHSIKRKGKKIKGSKKKNGNVQREVVSIFAQCLVKGRLSYYVNTISGTASGSVGALSVSVPSSDRIYYYRLNDNEAVSNVREPFSFTFWLNYLKDYPEFIDCLKWNRKQLKANKKLGVDCHFKTSNFIELAELFNKRYP